jgi:hypothetical protein
MESGKVNLQKLEKQLTKHFKLTSIEVENVLIPLQRILKARNSKPAKVNRPLSDDEGKKLNKFMRYLKTYYPISDYMGFYISNYAAECFFQTGKPRKKPATSTRAAA